jgi:hypothetical protein
MLRLTERQMRNLASQLGGRRAGRRAWVFDRALVELEASRRAAAWRCLTVTAIGSQWLRCGGCVSVWPIS